MESVQGNASFQDVQNLIREMEDKDYRAAFVEQFNRQLLARQMRGFRGDQSQADYGENIGKSQTQIARFEDPLYGWQMRTAFDIAQKQDVAVIMCFVDYGTFLKFEQMSESFLTPKSFDTDCLKVFIAGKDVKEPPSVEPVPAANLFSGLNSLSNHEGTAGVKELGLAGANVISIDNYQRASPTMNPNPPVPLPASPPGDPRQAAGSAP